MDHKIEGLTLAAMRAISAACICNARIEAPKGDYMLQFDHDRGEAFWYLDVSEIVDGEAVQ